MCKKLMGRVAIPWMENPTDQDGYAAMRDRERTGWKSLVSSHRTVGTGVPPPETWSTQLVIPPQPAPSECRRKYKQNTAQTSTEHTYILIWIAGLWRAHEIFHLERCTNISPGKSPQTFSQPTIRTHATAPETEPMHLGLLRTLVGNRVGIGPTRRTINSTFHSQFKEQANNVCNVVSPCCADRETSMASSWMENPTGISGVKSGALSLIRWSSQALFLSALPVQHH